MEKKFTVTAHKYNETLKFEVILGFQITNHKQHPGLYLRDQAEHWQNTIADALRRAGVPAKNINVFESSEEK